MTDQPVAVVPVKSAWASKVNWTQAAGAGTAIVTAFGLDIPPEYKAQLLSMFMIFQAGLTWVLRTWFSPAVVDGSLPTPPTTSHPLY